MENSKDVIVTWNLREDNHFHVTNATLPNYKPFHTSIRSHNTKADCLFSGCKGCFSSCWVHGQVIIWQFIYTHNKGDKVFFLETVN